MNGGSFDANGGPFVANGGPFVANGGPFVGITCKATSHNYRGH